MHNDESTAIIAATAIWIVLIVSMLVIVMWICSPPAERIEQTPSANSVQCQCQCLQPTSEGALDITSENVK